MRKPIIILNRLCGAVEEKKRYGYRLFSRRRVRQRRPDHGPGTSGPARGRCSEQIDAAVEKAQTARNGEDGPTVLYLRATAASVKAKSSRGTVLGEMLKDLGCINIADGSTMLENLSIEEIILRDPEYIFIVEQGNDTQVVEDNPRKMLLDSPAWSSLSAVKNGKNYYLDGSLYNLKPNDRWGIAYERLEELLYE